MTLYSPTAFSYATDSWTSVWLPLQMLGNPAKMLSPWRVCLDPSIQGWVDLWYIPYEPWLPSHSHHTSVSSTRAWVPLDTHGRTWHGGLINGCQKATQEKKFVTKKYTSFHEEIVTVCNVSEIRYLVTLLHMSQVTNSLFKFWLSTCWYWCRQLFILLVWTIWNCWTSTLFGLEKWQFHVVWSIILLSAETDIILIGKTCFTLYGF